MTRKGLIQPKPMMTRVCKPPQKKNSKKNFSGSNFFFKKKIFLVWGVSVIMGFLFKTKPVSSWVSGPGPNRRVIMGFPQTPRVTPGPLTRPADTTP